MPRLRCGTWGGQQADVPWAKPESSFTLLFEPLALSLAHEVSVAVVTKMMVLQEAQLQAPKRLSMKSSWADQIKLALARFLGIADSAEVISYLKRWCFYAMYSQLKPVIHTARAIKACWQEILNFLDSSLCLRTIIYL